MKSYTHSHGVSDAGIRTENQDALRWYEPDDEPTLQAYGTLYAIADGMGGYEHGSVASLQALEVFLNTFYGGKRGNSPQNLKQAMQSANLAVYQTSQRLNARMGTTLSAVNVIGNQCHVAHVGDSRVYRIRGHQAACLTSDHTAVGEMVRMRLITPEQARTHERRSVLQKCLGMQLFVQPDIERFTVEAGDTLVLCSDGVWAYIQDEEFAQVTLEQHDPDHIGNTLLKLAESRHSDDNLSVLVIRLEQLYAPAIVQVEARSKARPLIFGWLGGKG